MPSSKLTSVDAMTPKEPLSKMTPNNVRSRQRGRKNYQDLENQNTESERLSGNINNSRYQDELQKAIDRRMNDSMITS